jgi:hypothetical protein
MTITELIKELQNLEEYKNHTIYIGNIKKVSEVVTIECKDIYGNSYTKIELR